jgi:DHA1 family bicyclomycin/chloramphenicol resistance-like MFS transporter
MDQGIITDGRGSIVLILGALIALSPLSIDMYLPAMPAIAESFKIDTARVGYSLTSYYAGLCIGQLFYGVLIDRFGRKPPLKIGLLIYMVAALWCALSAGLSQLVIARLFMALGGCVGMVAARAVVRDLFPPHDTAKVLSILVLVMGLAPLIAPSIGSVVNIAWGWRWLFGLMGIMALSMLIAVIFLLPESKAADTSVSLNLKQVLIEYRQVLSNDTFRAYAFAGGIGYAGLYAYIAGAPFVMMDYFGLSGKYFAWSFTFTACGLILGSQVNRLALARYTSAQIVKRCCGFLLITCALLLVLCLMGLANPVMIIGFLFIILFWLGMINPNATALALSPFDRSAGRASALLGSIQMIAGVMASWMVSFLHNGSAVIMPGVIFGCSLGAFFILFNSRRLSMLNA